MTGRPMRAPGETRLDKQVWGEREGRQAEEGGDRGERKTKVITVSEAARGCVTDKCHHIHYCRQTGRIQQTDGVMEGCRPIKQKRGKVANQRDARMQPKTDS